MNENTHNRDTNPDPITGEPGAHPIGVGAGAAAGGATGAAVGMIGGPIGAAVGAAIGAVTGGLAGKGVAEAIDPTAEDAYWRENHSRQPYAKDRSYDEYAPAYRTGYEGASRHFTPGTRFEDAESKLRQDY
jgi:phage tail tape-measure protein